MIEGSGRQFFASKSKELCQSSKLCQRATIPQKSSPVKVCPEEGGFGKVINFAKVDFYKKNEIEKGLRLIQPIDINLNLDEV